MKKLLLVTLLVFVGAAVAGVSTAQDCQYHNLKQDFRDFALVDPGNYDFCVEVKVVGTIQGRWTYCALVSDFRTSNSIYFDGIFEIEASKYHSWIETKQGDLLELREWSWYDVDSFLEIGMARVIGGTGDFEGASGSLAWRPRAVGTDAVFPYDGLICTPED